MASRTRPPPTLFVSWSLYKSSYPRPIGHSGELGGNQPAAIRSQAVAVC
jgi:hypothetical protein